jgi:hypothetical protein
MPKSMYVPGRDNFSRSIRVLILTGGPHHQYIIKKCYFRISKAKTFII